MFELITRVRADILGRRHSSRKPNAHLRILGWHLRFAPDLRSDITVYSWRFYMGRLSQTGWCQNTSRHIANAVPGAAAVFHRDRYRRYYQLFLPRPQSYRHRAPRCHCQHSFLCKPSITERSPKIRPATDADCRSPKRLDRWL